MKRAVVLLALIACSAPEPAVVDKLPEPSKDAIVKTTDQGPVKVTLTVWPPKPSLGDSVYARVAIEAPPGITVDAPFQQAGDDTLGRFKVVAFVRDDAAHTQTYTLAPPTSGHHRIPPMRFEMLDGRGSGAPTKPQEILTEEVPIDVLPVSTEAITKPLAPALGALDESVGGTNWVLIGAIALGSIIALTGGFLLWRSLRARRRIAKQRSAYDEAVARLRELEQKGAPKGEDADRWFVDLSGIVREYLEGRYEIRAPELTTEEFLQLVATGSSAKLTPDHRTLLAAFLERADRVKFAGYRPDSSESLASLASARGFVEDTRLIETRVGTRGERPMEKIP